MPLAIPRPGKIVCVGLNYRDHAAEGGQDLPKAPLLFAKWPNTLIGDGDPVVLPPESTQVDYEAELGVVIGAKAKRVSERDALDHVAGYICVNDVSARDLQFADGQWTRGKSPDTFCPVGPRLVPREEIADPQALAIRCLVNGKALQDSSTAQMIFSVAEIIAYTSRTSRSSRATSSRPARRRASASSAIPRCCCRTVTRSRSRSRASAP